MNYTQIVSQEAPERELSSVELHSTTSDSQTTSDPLSRGHILSRSSVLSEGWCRSVLGKPCANVRVYSRGSNPIYRRENKPSDQESADNIGNLFGKEKEDRPKLPVSKRVLPKVQNSITKSENQQKAVIAEIPSGKDPLEDNQSRESRVTLENRNLSPENSLESTPKPKINNTIERDQDEISQKELSEEAEFPKKIELSQEDELSQEAKLSREVNLSQESQHFQEGGVVSNNKQNFTSRSGSLQDQGHTDNHKAGRDPEKINNIAAERDKGVPYLSSQDRQIERSKLRKLICYCDEDSQTSPPSILKSKPISKSDPVFSNNRNQKTWTGRTMDSHPEKDFSPRSSRDRHKIVLTSDKVQQTSDDLFFNAGQNTGSNTDRMDTTNTSINTLNCESVRVQTSERSSSSPEEEYHVWRSAGATMGQLCKCSPPRLSSLRRQSSFSSPSASPRTVDTYRSERSSTTPKKQPAKRMDIRGISDESGYGYCVPSSYRECPNYPCQQALRHKNPKPPRREHHPVQPKQRPMTPERRMLSVVPCDGSCRRCPRKPDNRIDYQPVPCRPPPPPYPSQFESSSSEERVEDDDEEYEEEDDDDADTSGSSRKHSDLPYQNNEEYLELVQELEETLQSRNRNRVNRAMKEFEHKSKYNRPLERPIINYGEASESEEPIMKKISELTEKRRNCKGDCCSCRKNEIPDRPTPRPPRMKPPTTKPWKNPKPSPAEHARWQMDNNSGEWFKICQNPPKRAPPVSRSPKKEHTCGCACSCGR